MKNFNPILFLFLLGLFASSQAQTNLEVQLPQGFWDSGYSGTISEATLTVHPRGLYMEVGKYQLRIFPMDAAESRKVKITYLAPVQFNEGKSNIELPVELLRSSTPDLSEVTIRPFHCIGTVGI